MTSPTLPKLTYEIGDSVWIDVCCQGRVRGVVVASFRFVDDPAQRYIIRLQDPDFPHEEIRDALLMSPAEKDSAPFVPEETPQRHDWRS